MSELRERHNKAELESALRQVETMVKGLEGRFRTILDDNKRLKTNVQDWKFVAGTVWKNKD
jgi:hypothetical protein